MRVHPARTSNAQFIQDMVNSVEEVDDVMRCFTLKSNTSARTRVVRLLKDRLAEKVDEFVENGTTKAKYRKTGSIML